MKNVYKIMILLIITSAHQLISTSSFAQAPQKMSYQAVIRNNLDQLVKEHAVGIQISILYGSESGDTVYVETQTPNTNENGLINIEIGTGTPDTGTFAGIDWSKGNFFIKTEVDPAGGTNYTITGTNQILSVPYALFAKEAETAIGAKRFLYNLSVYIEAKGGTRTNEFWTANIDGSDKRKIPISLPAGLRVGYTAKLTQDGNTLIFDVYNDVDDASFYSVSINGSNLQKLFDVTPSVGTSVEIEIQDIY